MYGEAVGELNVQLIEEDKPPKTIWYRTGIRIFSQGNKVTDIAI